MKTQHYKKKLEEEKAHLEMELEGAGRRNPAVPDDWESLPPEQDAVSDLVDQADVLTNQLNDAAILDALEARYDGILAALHRIEQSTFGACEVCGAGIAEDRLEANPSATTCALHMH